MTERPILFSAPMIRAILAGQKTQTRRALRRQFGPDAVPVEMPKTAPEGWVVGGHSGVWWCDAAANPDDAIRCPYGVPGDRLWVREAWNKFDGWAMYSYRADDNSFGIGDSDDPDHVPEHALKWKPSIHMPRAASRITLEITGVRVERLQSIGEVDATAEGVKAKPFPGPWWQGYRRMDDGELMHQQSVGAEPPDWMVEPHPMGSTKHLDLSAVDGFRSLWLSINGAGSWESDPWVWVVAFKRIAP